MDLLNDVTDGFSHIQHDIPVPVSSRTHELSEDEDAQGEVDPDIQQY